MISLTNKELVLLILIITFIITLIALILKKGIRVASSLWLALVIGSIGFIWLPEKVGQVVTGKTTINETINNITTRKEDAAIKDSIDKGTSYVADNYQSWSDALEGLVSKLLNKFYEPSLTQD